MLTGGARDQPDRLRTMRDAIAWSYDLLDEHDQQFFQRISVFVGGFDLAGAEAISKVGNTQIEALDAVTALVETSIVRQIAGPVADEPRYLVLEMIREFGQEKLAENPDEQSVRAIHAEFIRDFAEWASDHISDPGYEQILARLDAERGNARAALDWADRSGQVELGLRLATAMARFNAVRGHYREGYAWLDQALEGTSQPSSELRTRALRAAGWLARLQGNLDASRGAAVCGARVGASVGRQS